MYILSLFLTALVLGALYVITSSSMYEPPGPNDDGGEGLQPMPPTISGPPGSIRYRETLERSRETVRT